jgi:hypothetical protein
LETRAQSRRETRGIDKKNFGCPRIFRPRRSKASNQLMCPFWRRETESGTAPDIIKVPVIQAIHEGDGGMLAETSK